MAIQDNYPNLPGFVAQINDYGLAIPPVSQTLSESVLILGVAADGPVNTPVSVPSLTFATQLYGKLDITSTALVSTSSGQSFISKSLIRGLYEAFQAGCSDVRVCRVGGTFANVTVSDPGSAHIVVFRSGYPGSKYNNLTISWVATGASAGFTIVTTDGVSHFIATPTPASSMSYAQLLSYVNNSNLNVTADVTYGDPTTSVTLLSFPTTPFVGGSDGTNPTDAQYSQSLNAAYNALVDYAVDVVVPMGAYLQPSFLIDTSGNPTIANTNAGDTVYFGQNLAQFIALMSTNFHSAIGIISVAPMPFPTFTAVNQRIAQYNKTAYNFIFHSGFDDPVNGPSSVALGTDGNPVNLGRFLNIVAGPDFIMNNNLLGNYIGDAAASYAGLISSLAAQSATTNKVVPNILGLAYTYGLNAQNTLAGQAFTIFNTVNGTVRCTADNTYAPNGISNPPGAQVSDFVKLSTVRIVYQAVELVRSALQGYIGQPNSNPVSNAMATTVNTALKTLKASGALLDYQYAISATGAQQILGNVNVNLYLTPALEIRKIFVQVQCTPPGNITITSNATGV